MKKKPCSKCHQVKNLSEFNKRKDAKNGLRTYCKKCKYLQNKMWRERHPKQMQIYHKKRNILSNSINYFRCRKDFIIENCAICNSNKEIEFHHPNPNLPLHIYFLCHKHHFEIHDMNGSNYDY